MAELFIAEEIYYLRRPIQVIQQLQSTPMGLYPTMIPMLYFPFGEQQIYPFAMTNFVSDIPASDFDKRWYKNSLQVLYSQEIKRLLVTTAMFDEIEYQDKYIFEVPSTIQ